MNLNASESPGMHFCCNKLTFPHLGDLAPVLSGCRGRKSLVRSHLLINEFFSWQTERRAEIISYGQHIGSRKGIMV